jgi:hypothetical protein
MTISNNSFDSIANRAIAVENAINVTSTFNSFRDIGNDYLGSGNAAYPVIDFGMNSSGCASISDQFDRSVTEQETSFPWVAGNASTSAIHNGKEFRIGLTSHESGKTFTLSPGQASAETGLRYLLDNNTFNRKIYYMITRDNKVRTGILKCSFNLSGLDLDDDSSETGDVGVIFGIDASATHVIITYTSNSVPGDFTLVAAEQSLKTEW